jgi:hypothetical protein
MRTASVTTSPCVLYCRLNDASFEMVVNPHVAFVG